MGLSREEWRREFEQRRQEAMHLALRIREAQKHIRAADASQVQYIFSFNPLRPNPKP